MIKKRKDNLPAKVGRKIKRKSLRGEEKGITVKGIKNKSKGPH